MAAKTSFEPLAKDVVTALGGPDNIRTVTHCATRLRFVVKDSSKADIERANGVDGVITAIKAGGQHQVVIGNDVPQAYHEIVKVPGMAPKGIKDRTAEDEAAEDDGPVEKKNLLDKFIDMISAIITPLIWPLAGIALGKAFLTLVTTLGWLDPASTTHVVLNATFDGLFFFLPVFLAVTAARKFRANEFVAMATAAALVHPSIIALNDGGGDVSFFGIPVVLMSYASSVIPIIVAIWIQGYVERWFTRILPSAIRNFATPLLTVTVMVPLTLMTVGPITVYAANGISAGISWIFEYVPWLAGAILGAFWQVFVMFGLHWGFVPIMLNDIANQGFTYFTSPLMAAVLAQAGVVLAVALRSKNAGRRKVAGPAALSAFAAGVTEPAVYGVSLPLKYPFYIGIGAGAVGGAIIGAGRNAFDAFVFPSLLAFPAGLNHGSFTALVIGSVVAIILGFVATWLAMPWIERKVEAPTPPKEVTPEEADDTADREDAEAAAVAESEAEAENEALATAATAGTGTGTAATQTSTEVAVLAPVAGMVVPLAEVPDKVFASGAMGNGIAIEPANGEIIAPVTGKIIAVQKSGHAYGIKGADGAEVLVHFGLDTVQMKGEGFEPLVTRGDEVTAGQVIGRADLAKIEAAGHPATTLLVVTNTKKLGAVTPALDQGTVAPGDTVLNITR